MEALLSRLPQSASDLIGLAVDLALIIAIGLLWLTWYRNGKRQQRLEQMLGSAAAQLEEATRHLSEATETMQQLKAAQQEMTPPPPRQAARAYGREPARSPAASERPAPPPVRETPPAPPPQHSTQATMILRMHREGETAETIAERLNMPLAQVRLMLKLHTASTTAGQRADV
ncbi:hypothetical protein FE236_01455 [Mariprofundus erugo]|uniref:hypothetical protein n=1 Tax=Mariprofundus erugo TaxID=2528639 RepID=UPI0010FE3616|nr:hypothetical protein [Mariprofundus erugo]TLS78441.1 hypothetical protein FE236_01455 [Mariprofundus erugo]